MKRRRKVQGNDMLNMLCKHDIAQKKKSFLSVRIIEHKFVIEIQGVEKHMSYISIKYKFFYA